MAFILNPPSRPLMSLHKCPPFASDIMCLKCNLFIENQLPIWDLSWSLIWVWKLLHLLSFHHLECRYLLNSTNFFFQIAVCSPCPPCPVFLSLYYHWVQTFIVPGMDLMIFLPSNLFLFQSVLFSVDQLLILSFPSAHFNSFSFAYLIKSKLHFLVFRCPSCPYPLVFKIQ